MRLISLVIVLAMIGYLITTQLNSSSSIESLEGVVDDVGAPKIPTSPKDLPKFEDEINNFMQDSADERLEKFEEASSQ